MGAVTDLLSARRLTRHLGAQISGVDLSAEMEDRVFRAVYEAFLRYQVLLFPPMDLPPAAQVAFGRRFGEVQIHVMNQYHADGHPELYRLSNLDENGIGNRVGERDVEDLRAEVRCQPTQRERPAIAGIVHGSEQASVMDRCSRHPSGS